MNKPLPLGTTKCPKDGANLHWKQFAGMRLAETSSKGKGYSYEARCPECHKYYEVVAPKMID